jgi:hypothetical protein
LQRSFLGADDAPAHWCIGHLDAAFAEDLVNTSNQSRGAGRHVDVEAAWLSAVNDAVVAQDDLLDLLWPWQRSQHNLALTGSVGRRLGPARTSLQGGLTRLAPHVVHDEVVAGLL